jgi:hypothetical protein
MAQQTAVEWLYEKLFEVKSGTIQVDKPNLFEQAKAMEKQQIIDAFDNGCINHDLIGKEYYNETYNK